MDIATKTKRDRVPHTSAVFNGAGGKTRSFDAPNLGSLLELPFGLSRPLTDEDVLAISAAYPYLRIERTAKGVLLIMAPAGNESSSRNFEVGLCVITWAKQNGTGVAYESSAGFRLPNGALRSPDVSWVHRERIRALAPEQRTPFYQLCPDFVVEIRSPSDGLAMLKRKMEEYIANGTALGWLIDPDKRRVHVYRPDHKTVVLDRATELRGDPELPGLVVPLAGVWDVDVW